MKYLILITCFIGMNSFAGNAEIDDLAKPVMESISKGEVSKLATLALSSSSVSDYISKADLGQADGQIKGYIDILGKFYSWSLLHEQGIEGTFISRWYLLKYQRQPALIQMEFYKADKKWEVHSISLDLEVDDYIETQGKNQIGKVGE